MNKTKTESNYTASYIRALRKEAGLKQDTVAKLLGVRRATYSHYETGRLSLSSDKLAMLASYYQVTVDAMCRPPEDEHPEDVAAQASRPEKSRMQEVTRDDLVLLATYHHLTDREQRAVKRMMAEMAGKP